MSHRPIQQAGTGYSDLEVANLDFLQARLAKVRQSHTDMLNFFEANKDRWQFIQPPGWPQREASERQEIFLLEHELQFLGVGQPTQAPPRLAELPAHSTPFRETLPIQVLSTPAKAPAAVAAVSEALVGAGPERDRRLAVVDDVIQASFAQRVPAEQLLAVAAPELGLKPTTVAQLEAPGPAGGGALVLVGLVALGGVLLLLRRRGK